MNYIIPHSMFVQAVSTPWETIVVGFIIAVFSIGINTAAIVTAMTMKSKVNELLRFREADKKQLDLVCQAFTSYTGWTINGKRYGHPSEPKR